MQRNKKTVSLIYLACAFIVWLLMREMLASLWVIAHLPTPEGWSLPPSDIVAAACGIATFLILYKNTRVVTFTNEVITELSKVVWPNGKETAVSTGVVSVLVALCSIILFSFDMIWGAMLKVFYQ